LIQETKYKKARTAVENNNVQSLEACLNNNTPFHVEGHEPLLHTAARLGKKRVTACLIEHGADLNFANESGSALIVAIKHKQYEFARFLLNHENEDHECAVNVNVQDVHQKRALDYLKERPKYLRAPELVALGEQIVKCGHLFFYSDEAESAQAKISAALTMPVPDDERALAAKPQDVLPDEDLTTFDGEESVMTKNSKNTLHTSLARLELRYKKTLLEQPKKKREAAFKEIKRIIEEASPEEDFSVLPDADKFYWIPYLEARKFLKDEDMIDAVIRNQPKLLLLAEYGARYVAQKYDCTVPDVENRANRKLKQKPKAQDENSNEKPKGPIRIDYRAYLLRKIFAKQYTVEEGNQILLGKMKLPFPNGIEYTSEVRKQMLSGKIEVNFPDGNPYTLEERKKMLSGEMEFEFPEDFYEFMLEDFNDQVKRLDTFNLESENEPFVGKNLHFKILGLVWHAMNDPNCIGEEGKFHETVSALKASLIMMFVRSAFIGVNGEQCCCSGLLSRWIELLSFYHPDVKVMSLKYPDLEKSKISANWVLAYYADILAVVKEKIAKNIKPSILYANAWIEEKHKDAAHYSLDMQAFVGLTNEALLEYTQKEFAQQFANIDVEAFQELQRQLQSDTVFEPFMESLFKDKFASLIAETINTKENMIGLFMVLKALRSFLAHERARLERCTFLLQDRIVSIQALEASLQVFPAGTNLSYVHHREELFNSVSEYWLHKGFSNWVQSEQTEVLALLNVILWNAYNPSVKRKARHSDTVPDGFLLENYERLPQCLRMILQKHHETLTVKAFGPVKSVTLTFNKGDKKRKPSQAFEAMSESRVEEHVGTSREVTRRGKKHKVA